jgi:hypothetical protein
MIGVEQRLVRAADVVGALVEGVSVGGVGGEARAGSGAVAVVSGVGQLVR